MKIKLILFAFVLLFCISLTFAVPTNISSCQNITTSGSYILNTSITSTSTCINITSSNIILDGNGYNINYNSGSIASSSGISLVGSRNNISIINLIINDSGDGNGFDITGIFANNLTNSSIINNKVYAFGNFGIYGSNGITIKGNSSGNNITGNMINSTYYGLYFLFSLNDILYGNNITTFSSFNAIQYLNIKSSNISNNIINTGGHGIATTSSSQNIISNNNITASANGIYYSGLSSNDTIYNNLFYTGVGLYDMYIQSCINLNLIDQKIGTYYFVANCSITFSNSSYGSIKFSNITGTGKNLIKNSSSDIQIGNNYVYVNASNSGLNKTANINLLNIGNINLPAIFSNGKLCIPPYCTNLQNNNGNYSFSALALSNYTINSSYCNYLFNITNYTLSALGASTCGDANYTYQADINRNKIINFLDLLLINQNINNETFCQSTYNLPSSCPTYIINNCIITIPVGSNYTNKTANISYTYSFYRDSSSAYIINNTANSLKGVVNYFPLYITIGIIIVLVLLVIVLITVLKDSGATMVNDKSGQGVVGSA